MLSEFKDSDTPVKERKRRVQPLNIDDDLCEVWKLASAGELNPEPSHKSLKGLHHGVSFRRSRYIGVLRNRTRWQVLINVGPVKTYIGTF
mmetsp:Transcript_19939/g.23117  ORF Transcript_19939/g.23117 Transcript_19939/m.23117 type:complete len:90 (-) Transcript_19939:208-477(-)